MSKVSLDEWLAELADLKEKLTVLENLIPELNLGLTGTVELRMDMSTVTTRISNILEERGL